MFKKFLIPLDNSSLSEYALNPAIRLAQQNNAELFLLHVSPPTDLYVPEIPDLLSQSAQKGPLVAEDHFLRGGHRYLEDVGQNLARAYSDLAWHTLTEEGDPAAVIVDTAVAEEVDLIIMTTHGYSGITRWVMGSVTEKVLRHAPCPVLVVRSAQSFDNILITLDGSMLSEMSLPLGMNVAQSLGADVTLLRVDSEQAYLDAYDMRMLEAHESTMASQLANGYFNHLGDYLSDVKRRHRREGVSIKTAVRQGTPAECILSFADENETDLIVMTTHGHTGLRRWAYGSVTEKVLRGADCALLVIRPPDQDMR